MLNIKLIWWQYELAKPFFLRSRFNLGINLDFCDEFSQTFQFLSSNPTTVQKQTCLCYSAGTEPISTSFIYTLCFIPAISAALILYASPHLPLCLSLCVCVHARARMRIRVSFLHIRTLFHFLAACLQRSIINSSNFLMFLLFVPSHGLSVPTSSASHWLLSTCTTFRLKSLFLLYFLLCHFWVTP